MNAATVEAMDDADERGEHQLRDTRQIEVDASAEALRALFAGKEAGRANAAAGTNPHEMGTALAAAWERGRSSIEAQRLAEELAKRPRVSCQPCTCGGRGLCRDAA